MSYSTGMRSVACIAAIFAGGAAQADVTAAQVWEDWKAQLSLYGEDSVTIGSEESSGGTVTVRGITMTMDDGITLVESNIGDMVFSERGDGTVSVSMADSYPITVTDPDGVVITVLVRQSALEILVSGDADAMRYDISADRYEIALQDVVDGDITFTGDASLIANNLTGSYTTTNETLRNISSAIAIGSLDLLVDFEVPGEDGGYVTISGKINGISGQGDMTLPMDTNFENPEDIFTSGFAISGGYAIDEGAYVFDIDADGDRLAGSVSTGAVNLDFTMNAETVVYDSQTQDLAVNLSVPDFPFPIELGLATYGLGIEMPLSRSDEPSDFGFSLDLVDLVINDTIWDLFDPGKVLPRDPATVQLDVTGTATPKFDLLDPEQTAAIDNADMPIELNTMSLNDLRVALAGALVTGAGAFTFDNSDLETFDGMPRPEGDALIVVTGLNRLMDNLVAMGLVPEDQIMGGRMMLGMFARATGDDRLETQVEVNAEGHVIVNGQRLR